jgi:hypothetical protein
MLPKTTPMAAGPTMLLLTVLLLAAALAGCDRSGAADNVVARFDGGRLTVEDLEAHRRKMKMKPQFRKQPEMLAPQNVFEHAVNMELLIAKGLKEELHLDPRIRAEIHGFMADLFLKVLQERLVPRIDKDAFTEAEVRAYFEAHPETYRGQDFQERKAYVRNDLLYARYREAWQQVYDKLKDEFDLEVQEENLARFVDPPSSPPDGAPDRAKEAG